MSTARERKSEPAPADPAPPAARRQPLPLAQAAAAPPQRREPPDAQAERLRRIEERLASIEAHLGLTGGQGAGQRARSSAPIHLEPHDAHPDTRLNGRQLEVLRALSDGLTAPAIARRLSMSPRRVEGIQQEIYHLLGVHNNRACLREARRRGYCDL